MSDYDAIAPSGDGDDDNASQREERMLGAYQEALNKEKVRSEKQRF